MWDEYTARRRYVRYLLWLPKSRLLQRILPQLGVLILWSMVSVFLSTRPGFIHRVKIPLTPLSLVSTFVAALLTLRSNQGLNRLTEGRLAFGQVVEYAREMTLLVSTYIYPLDPEVGLLMGTLSTAKYVIVPIGF